MGKVWDLDSTNTVSSGDDVTAADDITAGDDASVGDDLTVNGTFLLAKTSQTSVQLENFGGIGCFTGPVAITGTGNGLRFTEGANCKMGVSGAMVAGTITISTTAVGATSRIFLTPQTLGTVTRPAAVGVTARVAGTSFTITSSDNTDTSTVAWLILDPA